MARRVAVPFALVLLAWLPLRADPRWLLTYARQYGEQMTGGVAGQAELFAHDSQGRPVRIGMTNRWNESFAIFGQTDQFGNTRIVFDVNNRSYDFHVFDPSTPSDSSPDCYWLDGLPHYGHYRFEFHWRTVADDGAVTAFPRDPIYHYDLVAGFNQPPATEPAGFSTDSYSLAEWTTFQAQTFVVPQGQNRIIAAKAFCVRRHGEKFTMRATIREGGPEGRQIGPAAVSREVVSNEFPNVTVAWDIEAIPVKPGSTYALRLDATDGQGFNVYATETNNYLRGMLYNGTQVVPGRDMIAVVIGMAVEERITFRRGDTNLSGGVDIADVICCLGYLFGAADDSCKRSIPRCLDAADASDNGQVDIGDPIKILGHLFAQAGPLPEPFGTCGEDPTNDTLDCMEFAPCEG
jgi:hypothetical protein